MMRYALTFLGQRFLGGHCNAILQTALNKTIKRTPSHAGYLSLKAQSIAPQLASAAVGDLGLLEMIPDCMSSRVGRTPCSFVAAAAALPAAAANIAAAAAVVERFAEGRVRGKEPAAGEVRVEAALAMVRNRNCDQVAAAGKAEEARLTVAGHCSRLPRDPVYCSLWAFEEAVPGGLVDIAAGSLATDGVAHRVLPVSERAT